MATRLRLENNAGSSITTAEGGTYSHERAVDPCTLSTSALSTNLQSIAYAPDSGDHLVAGDARHSQFISGPMVADIAFVTSDTVKYTVQCNEAHNNNNLFVQLAVYVISNDGATLRATLRSAAADGTEMSNSLSSRTASHALSANYTTVAGDRLLVEFSAVGTPAASGGVQGHNWTLRLGSNGAGGDLAENDSQTGTTLNPWIEFSRDITFQNAALTGSASTGAQTAPTPSHAAPLTGQAITSHQGDFADDFAPEHGEAAFLEQGTLSPAHVMSALTGQAITVGQGVVLVDGTGGDPVTVNIGGSQQITSAQGTMIQGPILVATGTAMTGASGTATPSATVPLTGSVMTAAQESVAVNSGGDDTHITSAQGTASPVLSQALTGSAITSAQGTITVSADDQTEALTGEAATFAQGDEVPTFLMPLTGQAITSAQENMGAPGFVALTGQAVTVGQGFLGVQLPPLTGQVTTSAQGTVLPQNIGPGNLLLFNNLITSQQGTLTAVNPTAERALTGQSITSASGTLIYGQVDNKNAALAGSAITSASGTLTASSQSQNTVLSLVGQAITVQQGTLETPSLWVPIDEGTTGWTVKANPNSGWTNIASSYVVTDYVEEGYVRNEGSDSNTSWTRK